MLPKTLKEIAVVMIVVFLVTVVVYPLLFSPEKKPAAVSQPVVAP